MILTGHVAGLRSQKLQKRSTEKIPGFDGIRTHASQSGLVARNYRLSYEDTSWERGKCLTLSFTTSELSQCTHL